MNKIRISQSAAGKSIRLVIVSLVALALLVPAAQAQSPADEIAAFMEGVNLQLEAGGADYRVGIAEYLTTDAEESANTIITKVVGNKQLGHDFVPGDARRGWSGAAGTAITYAIDTTFDAVPPFGGLGVCAVGRFSTRRITRDGDRSVSVTGEWAFWTTRRRWVRHGCLNRPSFGLICGRYPCHQAA